jgi:hypothetical protein
MLLLDQEGGALTDFALEVKGDTTEASASLSARPTWAERRAPQSFPPSPHMPTTRPTSLCMLITWTWTPSYIHHLYASKFQWSKWRCKPSQEWPFKLLSPHSQFNFTGNLVYYYWGDRTLSSGVNRANMRVYNSSSCILPILQSSLNAFPVTANSVRPFSNPFWCIFHMLVVDRAWPLLPGTVVAMDCHIKLSKSSLSESKTEKTEQTTMAGVWFEPTFLKSEFLLKLVLNEAFRIH